MAKRPKSSPEPVSVDEISRAILHTILIQFEGRSLDIGTAQAALRDVGFQLIQLALKTAGEEAG